MCVSWFRQSLKCNICHLNNARETWYEPGAVSSVLHTKSMYINAYRLEFCSFLCPCVEVMVVIVKERPPGGSEDPPCSLDISREEPPSFNSLVGRLTK